MPDVDNGSDPQDEAETFDETHGIDEDPTGADADDVDGDPAELTDVYDVTSALGDADDDEDDDEADDYDDEDIQDLDLDDEEDADEDEDSDLDNGLEDEPEYGARSDQDRPIDRAAGRGAPAEPGLSYVGDLDAVTNPRDDDVEKYETTRPLSDEQLADLGYQARPQNTEALAMGDQDDAKTPERPHWEERSFERDAEEAVLEDRRSEIAGSGATADDIEDEADAHESDLLDEGLEETFPASDPVSAKHIT